MKRGNLFRRMDELERECKALNEQIRQQIERILGPNPTEEQIAELAATLESKFREEDEQAARELQTRIEGNPLPECRR